jgi:hypothetical protein
MILIMLHLKNINLLQSFKNKTKPRAILAATWGAESQVPDLALLLIYYVTSLPRELTTSCSFCLSIYTDLLPDGCYLSIRFWL